MTKSAEIGELRRKLAGLDPLRQSLVREQREIDYRTIEALMRFGGDMLSASAITARANARRAVIRRQLADSAVAERVWRTRLRELTVVRTTPRRAPAVQRAGAPYLTRALSTR